MTHIYVHRPEEDPDYWRQRDDAAHPLYVWGSRLFWLAVPVLTGLALFERWGWL